MAYRMVKGILIPGVVMNIDSHIMEVGDLAPERVEKRIVLPGPKMLARFASIASDACGLFQSCLGLV